MIIYFACSITGGRNDEIFYQAIVDFLLAEGHQVPTAHLSRPDIMSLEQTVDSAEVFKRDMDWIESCQAMVAEVSTPSHGVGFEISSALSSGKPVLCLHRHGFRVSKMITGNDSSDIFIHAYHQEDGIAPLIKGFLDQIDQ